MPPIDNLDGLARRLRERPVAVITHGGDEVGAASVALWWADARGRPQAGWVYPAALAARDPRVARRLLWATRGRVVVGRRGVAEETVAALLRCAGEVLRAGEPEVIEIPAEAFADVPIVGGNAVRGVERADGVSVGRLSVGGAAVGDGGAGGGAVVTGGGAAGGAVSPGGGAVGDGSLAAGVADAGSGVADDGSVGGEDADDDDATADGAPAGWRVHCPVVRDVMVICELIADSTELALAVG
jgi:hypothetical protein